MREERWKQELAMHWYVSASAIRGTFARLPRGTQRFRYSAGGKVGTRTSHAPVRQRVRIRGTFARLPRSVRNKRPASMP